MSKHAEDKPAGYLLSLTKKVAGHRERQELLREVRTEDMLNRGNPKSSRYFEFKNEAEGQEALHTLNCKYPGCWELAPFWYLL